MPLEYMGIEKLIGITYEKKNTYNIKSKQMKKWLSEKKFFFQNLCSQIHQN